MSIPKHIPVLLEETMAALRPERGGVFVDATLGMGGHSAEILRRAKDAGQPLRLIGIDRDPYALEFAEERLGKDVHYLQGNFSELGHLRRKKIIEAADGILMDIGVSSYQIDTPERGFSFMQNGPLDMRMDPDQAKSAATIVNTWPEHRLAELFTRYGEERLAKKIAHAIAERRKQTRFSETSDLAEIISEEYHPSARNRRPHPATRVFQALRIEVNDELKSLEEGIAAGLKLLAPKGVLAIITFHSLEDRIVKFAFRDAVAEGGFELVNKKPAEAAWSEAKVNPRARSAKLRAIRRVS
jgi:16S rRNA (cytosine1402-N4)-methyltransferase